jgi:hypothetical protein
LFRKTNEEAAEMTHKTEVLAILDRVLSSIQQNEKAEESSNPVEAEIQETL